MSDDSTSHAIDERYSAVYDSAVELVKPPSTPSNDPGSTATKEKSAGYRLRKSSAVVVASEREREPRAP